MVMDYSIVQFSPSREGHSCGYCKSTHGNISDGMWAHSLTVQDYQDLIDRGWRRSGQYCYKPKMNLTCCPAYTIRCKGLDVQLSKSQKKILKRMRKFLIDGVKDTSSDLDSSSTEQAPVERCSERVRFDDIADSVVDINMEVDLSSIKKSKLDNSTSEDQVDDGNTSQCVGSRVAGDSAQVLQVSRQVSSNSDSNVHKKKSHTVVGMDPSRPLMKKAKLIRQERREKKLQERANSLADSKPTNSLLTDSQSKDSLPTDSLLTKDSQPAHNHPKKSKSQSKSIEDFINEPLPENRKHTLVIKLVRSEEKELNSLEWRLYSKYQMAVHHDKPDDCDFENFLDFLVASPLKDPNKSGKLEMGFGSFHQQYWLDGELIAVGVLDILPYCVSSVYFFYDPNYSFLSLGTYSSLREVALMRELNQRVRSIEYYYMGFYIHSCPKMRYKSKIAPSLLLCPEVYTWHPTETCLSKLDANKYSRLNEDPNAVDRESSIDLNKVLILWKQMPFQFKKFKRLCKKEIKTDSISYYAHLVGKTLSERLLYYIN